MKKFFLMLLLAGVTMYAQSVTVTNIQQITNRSDGEFSHAQFSPDDSKVFFTQPGFIGLYFKNISSDAIIQINDYMGAGYEPIIEADGKSVLFRKDEYDGIRKYSTVVRQNLLTGSEQIFQNPARHVSTPKVASMNEVMFTVNEQPVHKTVGQVSLRKNVANIPIATIENQKIAIYRNDAKNILAPLGEGNYIWPSVSPDGAKLLFTFAGVGTFVSDIDGNILAEIGYANYPQWSPDGKWIVYMVDRDNHERVTESDIYICKADGTEAQNLTASDDKMEMFPSWSYSGTSVVYNTTDGEIYKLDLSFNGEGE